MKSKPGMTMLFRVQWSIDIEAGSPQAAARIARSYQTRHDTTATVFEVYEPTHGNDPANGALLIAKIDLTYPEENQFFTISDLTSHDEEATARTTSNEREIT